VKLGVCVYCHVTATMCATVLQTSHKFTCVLAGTTSQELEDIVGAKFYCQYSLVDGNSQIWTKDNTLEFSSILNSVTYTVSIPCKSYHDKHLTGKMVNRDHNAPKSGNET